MYIHKFVYPPSLSKFRTFSSPQKGTLYPSAVIWHSPSSQPLEATSVSLGLPVPDTSFRWKHLLCGLLCQASFHLACFPVSFKLWLPVNTSVLLMLANIPLYGYATLYLCICQLTGTWVVSTFWLFGTAAMGVHTGLCMGMYFLFFWVLYPREKLLGHMVNLCLTFWAAAKTVLQSSCTILPFHQQCIEGSGFSPFSPKLDIVGLLIIVILVGVNGIYHIVICTSPVTNYVSIFSCAY